ncbi:MAG: ankyrin repeat domain-containing protein [Dongiaceae bacterium]
MTFATAGFASAGPLHDAAKAGDLAQIEVQLAAGADINESTGLATPLYYAIKEKHPDAAALLIERGADVNKQAAWGAPLHIAASEGMTATAMLLLDHGADIDARWKHLTPLLIAARNGKIEVVRLLLDRGADINATTNLDEPAVHLARLNGHADVADLLVARGTKAPPVEPIDALLATADSARGEELAAPCKSCHTVDRAAKGFAGPPLWNIVGRPKASIAAFKYSPALLSAGGTWTYTDLNQYIAQPAWTVPGVTMRMPGTHATQDRADIIAFLRTLSDNPAPLP